MIKLVDLKNLQSGMVVADNVFSPDENISIVGPRTILNSHIIEIFYDHGVTKVPIEMNTAIAMEMQLLPEVQPVLDKKLRNEAVDGIRRMFTAAGAAEENWTTAYQAVKELDAIVDQLVDSLAAEAKSLIHIADLKSYDEYTYHHSLSVAVLSIAIGQRIELRGNELRLLGRCAIMHDIGKIMIPHDIINKPGRLDATEFSMVKQHSEKGYEYLLKGNIGDEDLRQVVLCHHEKMDGSGYPHGLKKEELPLLSRIISVADSYDAITSFRSYRSPIPPAEAIEIVMSEAGFSLDYDIVKAFIDKLELYPINSCLELSNKRYGVVIDNTHSMRPILRMLDNGEILDLLSFHNLNLIITRVVDTTR